MTRRFDQPAKKLSRNPQGERPWRRHEKQSAERTRGLDRPRPNHADGTSFEGAFQRECKHTEGASIALKKEWLEKIDREAMVAGRKPLLVVGFDGMAPGVDKQWAVLPLRLLKELMDQLDAANESRAGG